MSERTRGWRMKRWLWLAAAVVASLTTVGCGGGTSEDVATEGSVSTSSDTPAFSSEPEGTFARACDMLLGELGPSGFRYGDPTGPRFVASAEVTNTGDVSFVAKMTARWKQAGTKAIVARKDMLVAPGATESIAVTRLATQSQVDAYQATYALAESCTVDVVML